MKTFSFKLNKDGIAETNIPEEYFLNVCNYRHMHNMVYNYKRYFYII